VRVSVGDPFAPTTARRSAASGCRPAAGACPTRNQDETASLPRLGHQAFTIQSVALIVSSAPRPPVSRGKSSAAATPNPAR